MDRTEALTWLNSAGLDPVMTGAGRTLIDEAAGYGPALDRAFSLYINLYGLTTDVTTTTVAAAYEYGFTVLLSAVSYDLALPKYALKFDGSVDAPLANLKRSQMYRQIKELRDDAWLRASEYGYSDYSNVGGWVVGLDFKEPGDTNGGGFG